MLQSIKRRPLIINIGLVLLYIFLYTNISSANHTYYFLFKQESMVNSKEDSLIINKADSLFKIALSQYYANNFTEAERFLHTAIKDQPENIKMVDYIFVRCHNLLGIIYDRVLNRFQDGLESYDNAINIMINNEKDYSYELASIYSNMGVIYRKLGDLAKAESHYIYAINNLELIKDQKEDYKAALGQAYKNIGVAVYELKRYYEAIDYFNKSLKIFEDLEDKTWDLCHNLALCYTNLKIYSEAERYYKLAFQEDLKQNPSNKMGPANLNLGYGDFLRDLDRLEEALPYLNRALELLRNEFGEKHSMYSQSLESLGKYYLKINNIEKALDIFQQSIIATVYDFNDLNIYSNPDISNVISKGQLTTCLKSKAQAFDSLYASTKNIDDLIFSFQTHELWAQLINKVRIGFQYEESKFAVSENEAESFNNIVEDAFRLYKLTGSELYKRKAFEYAEKEKAAIFQASMRDNEAISLSIIPQQSKDLEADLKIQLTNINSQLNNTRNSLNPDTLLITQLENSRLVINRSRDSLTNIFEKDYSEYYNLKYNTSIIDIDSLQNKLNVNDCLIEYVLTSSALFTLFIDKNKYEILKQENVNIDSSINYVREFISDPDKGEDYKDYELFTSHSSSLYKILIGPFEDFVNNKNMIIVPDGNMQLIPFDILLTEEPEKGARKNYKKLKYLINSHNLSVSYTSTLLFDQSFISDNPGKGILAFAPDYKNINEFPDIGQRNYQAKLNPLEGNREEVKNLRKETGATIFIDENASKENFINNAGKYAILHFAMHTILDEENPDFSYLVFANNNDTINDSFLSLSEIYNLELNAQLAVLSACNTGTGKQIIGEGVLSLARGFFYSGCPGVIMTLWPVDDIAGSDLMNRFYGNLKNGLSKDEALSKAKIEYIKAADSDKSHPYYWSSYLTIGNTSPIDITQSSLLKIGIYFIAFILLIILGFIFYKEVSRELNL